MSGLVNKLVETNYTKHRMDEHPTGYHRLSLAIVQKMNHIMKQRCFDPDERPKTWNFFEAPSSHLYGLWDQPQESQEKSDSAWSLSFLRWVPCCRGNTTTTGRRNVFGRAFGLCHGKGQEGWQGQRQRTRTRFGSGKWNPGILLLSQ